MPFTMQKHKHVMADQAYGALSNQLLSVQQIGELAGTHKKKMYAILSEASVLCKKDSYITCYVAP